MAYTAPVKEMRFVLDHIADMAALAGLPGYDHATPDVVEAVLSEAARVSGDVWAPTNATGDQQTSKLENGGVKTPAGFKDAYKQFADGGWNAFVCTPEFGGQGLP